MLGHRLCKVIYDFIAIFVAILKRIPMQTAVFPISRAVYAIVTDVTYWLLFLQRLTSDSVEDRKLDKQCPCNSGEQSWRQCQFLRLVWQYHITLLGGLCRPFLPDFRSGRVHAPRYIECQPGTRLSCKARTP